MMIIGFNDFRKLAKDNNKRIYYYQDEQVLHLYYIVDGVYIKSSIDLNTIENKEIFFGDALFVGATKLLFNIPDSNSTEIKSNDIISELKSMDDEVSENETAEQKGQGDDLQKEGVQ